MALPAAQESLQRGSEAGNSRTAAMSYGLCRVTRPVATPTCVTASRRLAETRRVRSPPNDIAAFAYETFCLRTATTFISYTPALSPEAASPTASETASLASSASPMTTGRVRTKRPTTRPKTRRTASKATVSPAWLAG